MGKVTHRNTDNSGQNKYATKSEHRYYNKNWT